MYRKILTAGLRIVATISYSFARQETIPFYTYMQYVEWLSPFQSHISTIDLHSIYTSIQNKPCEYQFDDDYFYVEPICLYQNHLPDMSFTEVIDTIRDHVASFSNIYNTAPVESFHYEWSMPIYKDNRVFDFLLLQRTQAHKAIATYHSIEENKIQVPKYIIAQIHAAWYTFYASYNDTSMRKWCAKTNYDIALASMDKVLLYPWHTLNFNKHISGLAYCTGRGRTDLQFYGWVCGAASQLYRTALITPGIQITQRHGHSERRSLYYGNDITGDDATIYEMYKQFEIKNNDDRGIYFRTIQKKDYDYLVAVSPYKTTQGVHITRTRETALRTNLTRSIYDKTSRTILDEVSFPTHYTRKNNTRN